MVLVSTGLALLLAFAPFIVVCCGITPKMTQTQKSPFKSQPSAGAPTLVMETHD